MTWIVAKIKWIMILSGLLSCAALYVAFEPREALDYLFDKVLKGALAEVIVRDCAVLHALVGGMLIYAAFEPQCRNLVLVVAGVSKLTFIGLMLWYGSDYLEEKVNIALGVDVAMVALFVTFMIGMRRIGTRRFSHSTHSLSQQAMPPTPRADVTARIPPPRPPMAKTP